MNGIKWLVGGFVALLIIIILNPFVIISAGKRGVVLTLGAVSNDVLSEGLHLRIPLIQKFVKIDVKMQKDELVATAASKDLQEVQTKLALNYHLDPSEVNKLYQKIGLDFKERVVDPAIQEAVKAATAKYTAEEAVTKRQQVRDDIKNIITVRLKREYIVVDEVSITNFDFSKSFNQAIEAKVTAEQNALAAKNNLEKIKFEQQGVIEVAKAQAEAIRIQAESISAQGGAEYVQLKAIEKWDGKLPAQMIPQATVPFLDLNNNK